MNRKEWIEFLTDLYLERVAILIHEGGMSEPLAKFRAYRMVCEMVGVETLPHQIQRLAT